MASTYISWVEPQSSHSNCRRKCPPIHPSDRQGGGQRKQRPTPIQDTLVIYKNYTPFLFHKAAQNFVKLIQVVQGHVPYLWQRLRPLQAQV